MATFVLVPGGWHDGWWFEPIACRLRRHGHEAYPLTLTGVGDRIHLLTASVNLDTRIQDVANVLEVERIEDAVLVGYSQGGMLITIAPTVPVANYLHFEDGKITSLRVAFDARELAP